MLTLLVQRAKAERTNRNIHRARGVSIASLIIILTHLFVSVLADEAELAISAAAPDFVLASSAGTNLRLSEYRGALVMLNFWSSSCGSCRDQLDWMNSLAESEQFSGINILSITTEADRHGEKHALHGRNLSFPVLFDTSKTVIRSYDPGKLPMLVMVDPHGNVRFIHEGYRAGDATQFEQQLASLLAE